MSDTPSRTSEAFRASILQAYGRPHCIHPFMGERLACGEPGALRVMTIGINAYLSEDDWDNQQPGWVGEWFRDGRHKFDRRVAADAAVIATALVARSKYFSGLSYAGKPNIFHTRVGRVGHRRRYRRRRVLPEGRWDVG
jgi:hypothetical protein